ncbi:hypothetical protein H6G41_03685 [Tolypothrix sp. FACHB-123]|uniref:hypothetical protein n=1 Tax=Tolypothrix sp. FACHB-123 TaxID=2692868 RepID=UPI001688B23A|nr:hypothetical protein [Tolypothrix sp. FACHB-123]MBD2353734.1 hypothetical protein [Tolypothrix sp. FACHB-123]
MSKKSVPTQRTQNKPKLGDQIRSIADRLKQETDVQIKATSRILGAAAQISENYDKLVDEVVDMVEEDLNQQLQITQKYFYTADILKQKFKTLREAKAHFQLKVNSWESLAKKLNEPQSESDLRNNRKEKVKQGQKNIEKVNVILDPDVAEVFPNSEVVNAALRSLIIKKNNF